jgi:glutamate dehydrogenase
MSVALQKTDKNQKKASFLVSVLENMRARLSPEEHGLAAAFTRQFWARVSDEDLADRNPEDGTGATIASLRRFQHHKPNDVLIDVENPEYERDGWASPHSVIMIVHADMPFLTDSVLMELSRHELVVHHLQNVVFRTVRTEDGTLQRLIQDGSGGQGAGGTPEVLIYAEIDRVETSRLQALEARVAEILRDVRAVVADFGPMKQRLAEIASDVSRDRPPLPADEIEEGLAFLDWLMHNSFTFLGYREFDFSDGVMRQIPGSALGILKTRDAATARVIAEQPQDTRAFILERHLLAFSKSGTRSQVHRPAYPDYIAVKKFNKSGEVIGEHGFFGMYTSPVYTERPERIPMIRRKVANIMARSQLDPNGFDGKVLAQVLATYPREELFQASEDELFRVAMAVTNIHERRRTRVFLRRDRYGLFYTCLVFMPRDLYNTRIRIKIQRLLIDALGAEDAPFHVLFSESILVRLHFTLRVPPGTMRDVDTDELERRIVALTRDWGQDLRQALMQEFGETRGRQLADQYLDAFPASYREDFSVRAAVHDIDDAEKLCPTNNLSMRFHRPPERSAERANLKIFHLGDPLSLSAILPALENMGVRVIGGQPYEIHCVNGKTISIHDFELTYSRALDIAEIGPRFEDAFVRLWNGLADNDSYNRLVLAAGLTSREVNVLRSYARYMRQTRFGFSQDFISDTLLKNAEIAGRLARYFVDRFSLRESHDHTPARQEILTLLDGVALLNEDRVLRRFLEMIDATVRTNYFQETAEGAPKAYLSVKLMPQQLAGLPQPVPKYEIFVFSPRVEGVHLRAGSIARGGLRWSDRHEDFRTEVLGLVKAQIVKNSVIVPTGAKGGFVVRRPPPERDAFMAEGVACYKQFISGLLDITDNIVAGAVVPPRNVRRYDGDDPYLVVAADKGTATFSDYANGVAESYGFWLGDAFASGGSNGYDHKKMAITARGGWISVQRHFLERGIDVQKDSITIVGVGDMSGDVFGNGLLRSEAVQLVAAFNHLHVFIDPNPVPATSFSERARLFALQRSGWNDYDPKLISPGGGVFARSMKRIPISLEMKARFGITADGLSPDELINALLKAPVDLVWNGGIGTYVRSTVEADADVGDRANDHVRVTAAELKAKVFGEGGNLGMTQAARVEYALAGGGVNTDFIDNSAGVDCSDHEVNIKILLNQLVADGDLTGKQRNQLLAEMQNDVAGLVLNDNFKQAQAISLAERNARARPSEFQRFITRMETDQRLDRALEGVPTDDVLAERVSRGSGLTRPELAVLLSYAKTHLKERLIASDIHKDPAVAKMIFEEFPQAIDTRFGDAVHRHRLSREIVATMSANDVVHHLGITSTVHLAELVGGEPDEIVRGYFVAAHCFSIREWFTQIETADFDGVKKLEMMIELMQLARLATRWFVRNRRASLDVAKLQEHFTPKVRALLPFRLALMGTSGAARADERAKARMAAGASEQLANATSNAPAWAVSLPIIEAAEQIHADPGAVAQVFAVLNHAIGIDWLAERLIELMPTSLWQGMERDALIDELMALHASLAARIHGETPAADPESSVKGWLERYGLFARTWKTALESAQRASGLDMSLLSITGRKLAALTAGLPPLK